MRAKQHSRVRRMPVPGKVCLPYVTGHRQLPGKTGKKTWLHKHSKKKFRPKRADKKLFEFLMYFYGGNESLAKKAMAQIKGRGLGELAMFIIADEFDEWWKGEWKYVNEGGQWVAKRQKKGERHRRAGKNWKKALPVINENREEKKRTEPDRFIKSFGPSSYSQARRKS
jgi:hypothetical protein